MAGAAVKTGSIVSAVSTVSAKLLVTGLDCPDCAAKAEKAVKRIPGVVDARIVFPVGRLDVEYDPQQTGITQVLDKIRKLGYEAREEVQKTYRKTEQRIEQEMLQESDEKFKKLAFFIPFHQILSPPYTIYDGNTTYLLHI
jgi:cation transport ATPase